MSYCLAIDIGASSGRHLLCELVNGKLQMEEVYRFENGMKEENGTLYKRYKRRYPIGAKAICDVWVFRQDVAADDFALQADEVSDVKIISLDELYDMQTRGVFKKRYFYLDDLIEEIKGQ